MSEPVSMPFWCEDWLTSQTIDAMTADEERGYLRLLARCWLGEQCSLPDDEALLAEWSKLGKKRWRGSKLVRSRFQVHPNLSGRLTNEKLLMEWILRHENSRKASESGKLGAIARWRSHENAIGDRIGDANGESMAPLPHPLPIKKDKSPDSHRDPSSEALVRVVDLQKSILRWKPDHRIKAGLSAATSSAWGRAIDLLHGKDEVSWERIDAVIDWLPTCGFWAPNIQSAEKLRKQFDRLEDRMRNGDRYSRQKPLDIPDLCE